MTPTAGTTPKTAIEYPYEDGEPMAASPLHAETLIALHLSLKDFFRDRPDVFVGPDMFWFWQEGNADAKVAPDVLVVPGVEPKPLSERRSFKSWEEGGAIPAAVFELASEGTWRKDRFEKKRQYQDLEVEEYFLFDPEARLLNPPLIGYRLQNGVYTDIDEVEPDVLESRLGFRLRAEGPMIRLIDAATGRLIPTPAETAARAERADALAAEVERLKALFGGNPP
ncbi:MAG: Uma2 family endonuclease [Gemmataceae bacterium]|nr:Uma2 family endonuclease [Gemmataceae bacterium]